MKQFCAIILFCLWGVCAFAVSKSGTVAYINGSKFYIHTVKAGETLYSLSKAYQVSEQVIVENNASAASGLKIDENIKIPFVANVPNVLPEKKLKKTFDLHYVSKGETLYAISKRYYIPIQSLIEDNPNLDPTHLRLGERILIRKKEIGSGSEAETKAQWEEYRQSLNSVADSGYSYHIVHPGETLYSLSHRFELSEADLSALNNGLKAADLKAGAMIKIPGGTTKNVAEADSTTMPQLGLNNQSQKIIFRALQAGEALNVALLLPISVGGAANNNYLEFYQGFLLGLDSVKLRGYSVHVELFNTGRDMEKVRQITQSPEFQRSNLIVGPVYEEIMQPVIEFAERNAVPVVSPLATISEINSDVLFQLSPNPVLKYEKAANLTDGGKQVTLIYTANTDKEFEREMLGMLGNTHYTKRNYKYEHPTARHSESSLSDLTPLLQNDAENVIIIMSDNEIDVDRILAALASAYTSLTSRGYTTPRFVVLGNARWNRYNNIDRTMFFKDRVVFLSTYHAKRDSEAIVNFDSDYIRAFGSLPTLYSYRGYDTAMIFAPGMYSDIEYDMEGRRYTPLQTSYVFDQNEGEHNHVNQNWTRVNYNGDFTITLE